MGERRSGPSLAVRRESLPVLLAGDPSDVLRRITTGDPLRLAEKASAFRCRRCVLFDGERFHDRVAARVALAARSWSRDGDLEAWLEERMEEACKELAREDRELDGGGLLVDESEPRWRYLYEGMGIEPSVTLRAERLFNECSDDERAAFFSLVLQCKSVQECLDAGLGPPERLRRNAVTAMEALFFLGEPLHGR